MGIHIQRQHRLSLEEARARVDDVAQDLKERLAADYHWEADRLAFSRRGVSGSIRVDAREVEVKVELGLLLRGLEGSIRNAIEERLDQLLAG